MQKGEGGQQQPQTKTKGLGWGLRRNHRFTAVIWSELYFTFLPFLVSGLLSITLVGNAWPRRKTGVDVPPGFKHSSTLGKPLPLSDCLPRGVVDDVIDDVAQHRSPEQNPAPLFQGGYHRKTRRLVIGVEPKQRPLLHHLVDQVTLAFHEETGELLQLQDSSEEADDEDLHSRASSEAFVDCEHLLLLVQGQGSAPQHQQGEELQDGAHHRRHEYTHRDEHVSGPVPPAGLLKHLERQRGYRVRPVDRLPGGDLHRIGRRSLKLEGEGVDEATYHNTDHRNDQQQYHSALSPPPQPRQGAPQEGVNFLAHPLREWRDQVGVREQRLAGRSGRNWAFLFRAHQRPKLVWVLVLDLRLPDYLDIHSAA
eukprot:Hpha_TRINITY_DN15505_c0_g1::TRINITY_DN15505_c0_g1_i1::g.108381::m.108381